MKIFGLHWTGHIGYLVVLAVLVFYSKSRLTEANLLQEDMDRIYEQVIVSIKNSNYNIFQKIEVRARECSTPFNQEINQNAQQALRLIDSFSIECDELVRKMQIEEQLPSGHWAENITNNYFRLGQKFKTTFKEDSSTLFLANQYLAEDYAAFPATLTTTLLNSRDYISAGQLIHSTRFKAQLTLNKTLGVMYAKMQHNIPLDFSSGILAFSFDPSYPPRARKPFRADVFMTAYPVNPETWAVSAMINNHTIPMEKGIAHYDTIFRNPGKHTLPVTIAVKNELTQEVRTYKKNFTVPVSLE